ncbi:MAG: BMP family ABC transporter substrate-binding protein [Acidimicrobiia bacterium]
MIAAVALTAAFTLAMPTLVTASTGESVGAKRSLKNKKVAVLIAGDRNDGGFYEGQVTALEKLAKKLKFDLVVIDKVGIGTSTESFENAARQNPAIIFSTGSELLDGFNAVCENPQYKDIFYMSQAAFPPVCKNAVHFSADDYQSHYLGGVAAALILEAAGKEQGATLGVVAGPELSFVVDDNKALEEGLKSRLPDAQLDITFTGDFENAALAQEATEAFINQGADLLYPYLGGAVIAAVQAANAADVPILAVAIDGCGIPAPGPQFAGSILFNPAPGFAPMLKGYQSGKLKVGDFKVFGLETKGVGANICNATPEQQKILDETKQNILDGDIEVKAGGFVKKKDGNYRARGPIE